MKTSFLLTLAALLALVAVALAAPPQASPSAAAKERRRTSNDEDENAEWTDYVEFISGLMNYVGKEGDVFRKRDEAALEKRVSSEWEDWLIFIAGLLEFVADNEDLFTKRAIEQLSESIPEERITGSHQATNRNVLLARRFTQVLSKVIQKSTRASDDDDDNKEWTDYMTQVAQMLNLVAMSGNMFSRDVVPNSRLEANADNTKVSDETWLEDYREYLRENPHLADLMKKKVAERAASMTDEKGTRESRNTVEHAQSKQVDIAARQSARTWADYLYIIAGILRMIATGGSIFD